MKKILVAIAILLSSACVDRESQAPWPPENEIFRAGVEDAITCYEVIENRAAPVWRATIHFTDTDAACDSEGVYGCLDSEFKQIFINEALTGEASRFNLTEIQLQSLVTFFYLRGLLFRGRTDLDSVYIYDHLEWVSNAQIQSEYCSNAINF